MSKTDEPAEPDLPPFCWLKRLSGGLLCWLIILVIVYLAWEWRSRREWNAYVRETRARGEPALVEDVRYASVAEEANAATLIREAARRLPDPYQLNYPNWSDFNDDLESVRAFQELAHRQTDENAAAFEILECLSEYKDVDWGIRLSTPVAGTLLPHTTAISRLGKALGTSALVEHDRLNDAVAIRRLFTLFELSDRAAAGTSIFVIDVFQSIRIESDVCRVIESILSDLQVTNDEQEYSVTRSQIAALIARLSHEAELRESFRGSIIIEKISALDTFRFAQSGGSKWSWFIPSGNSARWTFETLAGWKRFPMLPAWRSDAVRTAKWYGPIADACQAPNFQLARKRLPLRGTEPAYLTRIAAPIFAIFCWDHTEFISRFHRSIAMRRMAAIGLAIHLYQLDSGGLPARLEELVPAYLPAIPLDPFAADERCIAYVPNGRFPHLYSVGPDGDDDRAPEPWDQRYPETRDCDLYFFLSDRPTSDWPRLYEWYRLFEKVD